MWCFQHYREGGGRGSLPVPVPLLEKRMAESTPCLQILEEAMERVWFHENILTSFVQLGLASAVKKAGSLPPPPPPPASTTHLVADSEDRSNDKSRYHSQRKKPPAMMKIITSNQLFQLPPSPLIRRSRHRSPSPPPAAENSPQSRNTSRRPPARMTRSYKSFSELEEDELKGFMDLGFVFQGESLSPRMMSVIPGLQRLGKKASEPAMEEEAGEGGATVRGRAKRPYLAEAWFIKRPNSPLLNLKMLPAISTAGDSMKKQLRFWARTVASTIHGQES